MIKLKKLLESANNELHVDEFSKILRYAYITLFDIDDVVVDRTGDLMPPSYCHSYMVANVSLKYKMNSFYIYHKLYYYKFPPSELKKLSSEEWNEMLKCADNFSHQPLSPSLIKSSNNLIKFTASVYKNTKNSTQYFDLTPLNTDIESNNMSKLIAQVKHVIDKSEGSDGSNDEPDPLPVDPVGKEKLVSK